MSEPFVGEIRMFAGNFAPRGWAFCDGQLLAVSQNEALFSLLSTMYGGDGKTTFGVPDMRGRIPIHPGSSPYDHLGTKGGQEQVSLTVKELPPRPLKGTTATATTVNPVGNAPAHGATAYLSQGSTFVAMADNAISNNHIAGGGQPHDNLMPFVCIHFIIALVGVYPSPNGESPMSEPFIGEIQIFAGNFAPRDWALCNGQLLAIAQNTQLFSIIGNTYGGDGRTTTGLPNLMGHAPMHPGEGPGLTPRRLGEKDGTETITLTDAHMPSFDVSLQGVSEVANQSVVGNNLYLAKGAQTYFPPNASPTLGTMDPRVLPSGGGQAHTNMQPYLAMTFIISLAGLFPERG